MIWRKRGAIWPNGAHLLVGAIFPFAVVRVVSHPLSARAASQWYAGLDPICYPSPIFRPDPDVVGPPFCVIVKNKHWQRLADGTKRLTCAFLFEMFAVHSADTTSFNGDRQTCNSQNFLGSRPFWYQSRPVIRSTPMPNVARWVQRQVPGCLRRPEITRLPVQSSVVRRACSVTTRVCAANQPAKTEPIHRPSGPTARVVFSFSDVAGGKPACSRRS